MGAEVLTALLSSAFVHSRDLSSIRPEAAFIHAPTLGVGAQLLGAQLLGDRPARVQGVGEAAEHGHSVLIDHRYTAGLSHTYVTVAGLHPRNIARVCPLVVSAESAYPVVPIGQCSLLRHSGVLTNPGPALRVGGVDAIVVPLCETQAFILPPNPQNPSRTKGRTARRVPPAHLGRDALRRVRVAHRMPTRSDFVMGTSLEDGCRESSRRWRIASWPRWSSMRYSITWSACRRSV